MSRRLVVVQRRLSEAIDQAPRGSIRLVSMCAGQGRDAIGVLSTHDRSHDIRARLVELDPHLARHGRSMAQEAGLENVGIDEGDASTTSAYAGMVPAHIVLICGVFGNISAADIHATVAHLPCLLMPDATVIWTRHRLDPDLTPTIRTWFHDSGFDEVAFDSVEGTSFGVGTHRLVGDPQPFEPNRKLFTFFGDGAEAYL